MSITDSEFRDADAYVPVLEDGTLDWNKLFHSGNAPSDLGVAKLHPLYVFPKALTQKQFEAVGDAALRTALTDCISVMKGFPGLDCDTEDVIKWLNRMAAIGQKAEASLK